MILKFFGVKKTPEAVLHTTSIDPGGFSGTGHLIYPQGYPRQILRKIIRRLVEEKIIT